jgi:hypothetical protein
MIGRLSLLDAGMLAKGHYISVKDKKSINESGCERIVSLVMRTVDAQIISITLL